MQRKEVAMRGNQPRRRPIISDQHKSPPSAWHPSSFPSAGSRSKLNHQPRSHPFRAMNIPSALGNVSLAGFNPRCHFEATARPMESDRIKSALEIARIAN